ncbi:hypothetical protein LguiA_024125 [Lonicera macranthoides]
METTKNNQVNSIVSTTTRPTIFIDASTLQSILTYKTLITHFQNTLPSASSTIQSPIRHTHQTSPSSSLLLMPSWSHSSSSSSSLPYIGVKLVTHHPLNSSLNLPSIHATYLLFNSLTGQTLASIDGTQLTLVRTACVSALASQYLSQQDSKVLIMVGAGSLAPHLIKAHLTIRPSLKRVIVWNRTIEKARMLVDKILMEGGYGYEEGVSFESNENLEEVVGIGDIVSCATNSEVALVKGVRLKEGAHLDLVGSFKETMKECDDEAIRRGRVFVDNEGAVVEAGELVGAFERGVIKRDQIEGTLVELIRGGGGGGGGGKIGRRNSKEITVFKSVGSGVVDLLSAQLVYETYINK